MPPARFLIAKIASDQTAVGLASLDEQLARLMVRQVRDIQALVRLTVPKNRNMNHCQALVRTACGSGRLIRRGRLIGRGSVTPNGL